MLNTWFNSSDRSYSMKSILFNFTQTIQLLTIAEHHILCDIHLQIIRVRNQFQQHSRYGLFVLEITHFVAAHNKQTMDRIRIKTNL